MFMLCLKLIITALSQAWYSFWCQSLHCSLKNLIISIYIDTKSCVSTHCESLCNVSCACAEESAIFACFIYTACIYIYIITVVMTLHA